MKNLFALALALLAAAVPLHAASTQIRDKGESGLLIGTTAQQKVGFHGAQPVAQRAGSAQAPITLVYATGTLTSSANYANTETVTIGSKTYTFKTSLSGSANEVLVGADEAASIANLAAAINGTAGAGTTYGTGTTANASAAVTSTTAHTIVVTALAAGTAGNSIASTETASNAAWGGSTLSGGTQPDPVAEAILLNELRAALVEKGLIKGGA